MPTANINNPAMHYEVLGQREPALCMGGWGPFCRKNHGQLARGLTDRDRVIVFDYRSNREHAVRVTRGDLSRAHAR